MKTRAVSVVGALLGLVAAAPVMANPASVDGWRAISRDAAFTAPCPQVPFGQVDPEGEFQPQVAVHPDFPDRLAAVWTQGLFLSAVVGVSDDGGSTWRQVHVPISRCSGGTGGFVGDPWIVWGPDGTLHVAAITDTQFQTFRSQVVVTRSADGGRTWTRPVVVEDDGRKNDRETLAVDPNNPARLYLAWTKTLDDGTYAVAFSRSDDGGRSWSASRAIYHAPVGSWPNGASTAVLPDGTLVLALEELEVETSVATQRVLRSFDGGTTWTTVYATTTDGSWPRDPETGTEVIGNASPAIDVAPDGSVLLAWQDMDLPDSATIWITRSRDGGSTWEPKVAVRRGPGQAWGPTLAVGARDLVAVTWYDTRADRDDDGRWVAEVWGAHAHLDDLHRWSETRLAGPLDLLRGLRSGPGGPITLGNYFGLEAMKGGFGAVFSLPAEGDREAPQDIAFARLTFPGRGW